jgi:hypothetical protein
MKMRCLPILLVSSFASPAHAWTTESLTITGGSMTMYNENNSFGSVPILPGPSNTLDDGLVNGAVDADGLHGSPASPVTTFMFLGIPWKTFFAHSVQTPWTCNPDCTLTVADPEPGAVTVSGTAWDPAITADFSGFFTEWNGNSFRQGGQATGTGSWVVVPTPEAGTGLYNFTLQWSAYHDLGPFQGFTSDWVLTGTAVAVVPEPATYAMLLAGLGLVGAAARRRPKPGTGCGF